MIHVDDDTWLDPHTIADLRVSTHRPDSGHVVLSVALRASTATVVWTFPACPESQVADTTTRARALAADIAEQISRGRAAVGVVDLRRSALDPRGTARYPSAQVFAVT